MGCIIFTPINGSVFELFLILAVMVNFMLIGLRSAHIVARALFVGMSVRVFLV
jgi:hypothetical protein